MREQDDEEMEAKYQVKFILITLPFTTLSREYKNHIMKTFRERRKSKRKISYWRVREGANAVMKLM